MASRPDVSQRVSVEASGLRGEISWVLVWDVVLARFLRVPVLRATRLRVFLLQCCAEGILFPRRCARWI